MQVIGNPHPPQAMTTPPAIFGPLLVLLAGFGIAVADALPSARAAEGPSLRLERAPAELHLAWPATRPRPDGSVGRPWFEVQFSPDLVSWQPTGQRVQAQGDAVDEELRLALPPSMPQGFYRLLAVEPAALAAPGQGGPEVFGYGDAFATELARLGQLSPDAFAALHPSGAEYLPGISWDPLTATFWDLFNADPAKVNQGKTWDTPGYRSADYRLNPAELAIFRQNGFVVSERLGWIGGDWLKGPSMGNAFYQLWYNDLPVFVSADAILHAWHRTYDLMLEEIEEAFLFPVTERLLEAMSDQLKAASAAAGEGILRDSLLDADYLLTVGRSLLQGSPAPSPLGQDARVARTLLDIHSSRLQEIPDFMGFCRTVDFSQFQPRGHYTHSDRLQRYFQCLMWLGRIDLPVAGGPFMRCPGDARLASPRELGTALVLHQLLTDAGALDDWTTLDAVIQTFVGWSDSLTFPQLSGLLAGAGIHSLADVRDLATLEALQANLARGQLGVQNIRSDAFFTPLNDTVPVRLPQSFLVFGQRFTPDSWVFSQVVYDAIQWEESGVVLDVPRRLPGALDIAFAALGNSQVVPELVARIVHPDRSVPPTHADLHRDGHAYQHNLAAARAVIDAQTPAAWDSNLYLSWLACLRELSPPTTGAAYPEAMRTHAWAMRTLNTQLASWTQLRHDTLLYTKQSYTSIPICFYPAGFVEPRPAFWQRLESMAAHAADLVASLTYPEGVAPVAATPPIPLSEVHSNQVAHLRRFAATVRTLGSLAEKELAQQPFSPDDELFLRNLMQEVGWDPWGSGRTPRYSGWYPALFYRPVRYSDRVPNPDPWTTAAARFHETYGAAADDLIVADVHTDPPAPDQGDPGSVLHQAIGGVGLLLIAIDNGADRMVYAGPVLTHYELDVIGPPLRLTDELWKDIRLGNRTSPQPIEGLSPPPWTRGFLVPR